MAHPAYNPYLPSWEYTPDCEPHVFGDRLYVFGSHDAADGQSYCVGDYVSWSAPVTDLSDWRFEGVVYTRWDDPNNAKRQTYAAPDVCQGPDGRYYLYYFYGFAAIGVAVCDEPAGHYRYLGNVALEDGTLVAPGSGIGAPFDPAVYVEGTNVWLYYGFGARPSDEKSFAPPEEMLAGSYVARLAPDMHTIVGRPRRFVPGPRDAQGTSFEGHPFLEASSFRKIGGRYYFIYSSSQGHELCWAKTSAPDVPPTFGGVVISNGDVGLHGIESEKDAVYYLGNNHGSIVSVGGRSYVFYHRHTHGNQYARQACAEPLTIDPDGTIEQAEVTSCGLNGGPLAATREIPAYICCHLRSSEGILHYSSHLKWREPHPFVTQETGALVPTANRAYVHNLRDGAELGYKYLSFPEGVRGIRLEWRGDFSGCVHVRLDSPKAEDVAALSLVPSTPVEQGEWTATTQALCAGAADAHGPATTSEFAGTHALYFVFEGLGSADVMAFQFLA